MGSPPQVAKNGPFPNETGTNFISAATGCILQFLAFWAFISFHFGLLGLHFLSFWHCGPSFLFILAFWAFISFIFGLSGLPRGVPTGLGSSFGNPKLFADGPYQGRRGLGGIKVYIGPRGGVHPSVTRSSLLKAPIGEDAAWAASRYVLGHGAGFTLR